MSAVTLHGLKRWVKQGDSPLARSAYQCWRQVRGFEFPCIPVLHRGIYAIHKTLSGLCTDLMRIFYWTPLFKARLSSPAKKLYLFGGMPTVLGSVDIDVGAGCRVAGMSTISGRSISRVKPRLVVGDNCDIGWQTTIAVGSRVVLGNNVRMAGRVFLAGYPGHPIDAQLRAKGLPDMDEQVGEIILEDDVWLATGVFVMSGVRIGQGTIVAAGSVVTRDLPSGVLAAGSPAKVVRSLSPTGEGGVS